MLFTDLPITVGCSWQDFDPYFMVTLTNTYHTLQDSSVSSVSFSLHKC